MISKLLAECLERNGKGTHQVSKWCYDFFTLSFRGVGGWRYTILRLGRDSWSDFLFATYVSLVEGTKNQRISLGFWFRTMKEILRFARPFLLLSTSIALFSF